MKYDLSSFVPLTALFVVLLAVRSGQAVIVPLNGPGDFIGPATTINFDQHGEGTATNTLYLAQGVEFFSNGSTVPIYDWAGIGRVTTSSPNVVATVSGLNGSAFSSTLDLIFDSPTVEVGAYFGNDQIESVFPLMTLSLFDGSNSLIGLSVVLTNNNTSVDQFIGLRSTTPFVRARFDTSSGLSVVLDDVSFASVPEPTALAMCFVASCTLGCWRGSNRRFFNSPAISGG